MSKLESKAKSVNEILSYVHDAQGFIGLVPGQGVKLAEYGREMWIPQVDVEQVISEWQAAFDELKAKVEAANKLLDEKIVAWDDAYSIEANDIQWGASEDLKAIKLILQSNANDKTKEK